MTSTAHDWILGGDVNASLHAWEQFGFKTTSYMDVLRKQRTAYREFINESKGKDAWDHHTATTDARYQWTCRVGEANRIVDRFVLSQLITPQSIRTHVETWIPETNHRPVTVTFFTGSITPSTRILRNLAPPRLKMPRHPEMFESLRTKMDASMLSQPPPTQGPPRDNGEYDALLSWCDQLFITACNDTFYRAKRTPANPAFDLGGSKEGDRLARELKAVNRLIRAVADNRLHTLDTHSKAALQRHAPLPEDPVQQLKKSRNAIAKAVRKDRQSALNVSAQFATRRAYQTALTGGRIKHLFEPNHITNPPVLRQNIGSPEETIAATPTDKLNV